MAWSDYTEPKILDHWLGSTAPTIPSPVHVALFTATLTDVGGGTEVTGGSYARKSVTNNTTNWPAASGSTKSNGTAITFVTASADWGTVVAFGIFDAATAGNLICWGALTTPRLIASGATAEFAIGALQVTQD